MLYNLETTYSPINCPVELLRKKNVILQHNNNYYCNKRVCQSQRTALCFIGDACPDSERSPIAYAVFEKRTTKKPKHNHLELNSGKIVRYIMMIPNSAV